MSAQSEIRNMAVFCDFENVARGVAEANYDKFDIELVLDKLLIKGNIVAKRAYCDWARYKDFKRQMHEAAFEVIDIPHVRVSGKNSADIRMVVDALDLCYTKIHIDTFVLITGDSDFSPLVSKLKENNKIVIGLGVKKSTSDLLSDNCHEFIFYDDLVRAKQQRRAASAKSTTAKPTTTKAAVAGPVESAAEVTVEQRRQEMIDLVVDTLEDLLKEIGGEGRVLPGPLKNALMRKRPGFDESGAGYSSFSRLLEDAEKRGLLKLTRDEKTSQYLIASAAPDR
ncbi:MAG: NYN domain-containing protein [Burkholderiaceae bacterium]|nr:NYN domain-containing protein [Burkholderiaceae bacterium]